MSQLDNTPLNTSEETSVEIKHVSLITQADLNQVFFRSLFEMATINYERFQALGYLNAMSPVLKKLYPETQDLKAAMLRHLEMYNSHPWMINPILGTSIALEEKIALKEIETPEAVNALKVGLMGPFAGIGDSLFWGTLRPILCALGAGIALQSKSIAGAIIFLIIWNIINFGFRYFSLQYGYKAGTSVLKEIKKSNIIQKISEGSSVLGLTVLGVLVAQWVNIKTGITLGTGEAAKQLQTVLDGIVPSLLPLLVTLLLVKMLRKKITPNRIIIAIFGFSFAIALFNHFTGLGLLVAS